VKQLGARAGLALAVMAAVMGVLLFVPAGTLRYAQAWVYLGVFMGASVLMTLDLLRRDPALLERRLKGGPKAEKEPTQRLIVRCAALGFAALLVVPALDHRFGWSATLPGGAVAGNALVAAGLYLIHLVYRENTFAAASIDVAEQQTVVSTGPYAIVRHPMYAGAALYFIGTPLALGSYWGFVPAAALMAIVVWRLVDEERFLVRHLPGYVDYRQRVQHRLVPFVW
jgi:protein-S-isoprenylcysteine O-methyltransferase Ste14